MTGTNITYTGGAYTLENAQLNLDLLAEAPVYSQSTSVYVKAGSMYEKINNRDIHSSSGLMGEWIYIDMGQYPELAKTLAEKGGYVKVGYYETKMSTDTVQYRIFKSAYSIWKEIDGDNLVRYIEFLKKNK